MADPHTHTNDGLIPLIVAVTGHRDPCPSAAPILRRSIHSALDRLASGGGPIVVLSALARGADQLVAQVALERGCELIVPLPMPIEIYREQLADESAAAAFDALLARASHHYVLDAPLGVSSRDLAANPQAQQRQFHALACELAQLGHVMLALWDGLPGKVGGTGDAVATRLGEAPAQAEHDHACVRASPPGPVWAIVTPREACDPPALGEVGALLEVTSSGSAGGGTAQQPSATQPVATGLITKGLITTGTIDGVAPLRAYNAMAARLMRDEPEAATRSIRDLGVLDWSEADSLSPAQRPPIGRAKAALERMPPGMARTIMRFTVADALAQQFQRAARRLAVGRLVLVLFGVMAFELTTGPAGLSATMLLGYLAAVVVGVWGCKGLWHRADRGFLEWRTLAEHERVRIYLALAGIEPSARSDDARTTDLEAGLLGMTARVWHLQARLGGMGTGSGPTDRGLRLVNEHWIGAQRAYFGRALAREHAASRGWSAIARLAMGTGLVVTAGVIGVLAIAGDQPAWRTGADWALLAVVWLMILAAMVRAYIGYRAFDEHINRYDAMRSRFERAGRAVESLLGPPGEAPSHENRARAERIISALADEAIRENIAWHVLHRERPVEVEPG